ncbi:MAG: hypothetical protein H7Z73_05870 [Candidatus Saccharibacteria bacterium]|nr:hypothetical protein [Moraxellaceae bacterium]
MTDLRMEEATPEEISALEQDQRFMELAIKRAAAARSKVKEDAREVLVEHLEKKKSEGKFRL